MIRKAQIGLLLLASLLQVAGLTRAAAASPVAGPGQLAVTDVSVFYEPLARHGRWFQHSRYGTCWIPNGVAAGWRPYTRGYWDFTDDGWAWVSYEEWGWGPYHYGRWSFDPEFGWVWIPGTVWAPAWVAWRRGPGYVGWAPLPYEARWEVGIGIVRFDYDRCIEPRWYCFVGERHFCDRYVERVIELPARNITIIHNTTYVINNYTVVNNHIVNHGIRRDEAERCIGRPIDTHHMLEARSATAGAKVKSGDPMVCPIYRPEGKPGTSVPPVAGGKLTDAETRKLEERHRKEQERLEADKLREKTRLENQHGRELDTARTDERKADKHNFNGGSNVEELKRKHEDEHLAHDQHWLKEKDAMPGRHTAERAGKLVLPPTYHAPKQPRETRTFTAFSQSSGAGAGKKKH